MERAQRATGGCQGWGVQGGGARRGERRPRLAARGPGLHPKRDACPERRASAFTETRAHGGGLAVFRTRVARPVRRSEHELRNRLRRSARASGDARAVTRAIGGGAAARPDQHALSIFMSHASIAAPPLAMATSSVPSATRLRPSRR